MTIHPISTTLRTDDNHPLRRNPADFRRELRNSEAVAVPQFKSRFLNLSGVLPRLAIPRVLLSFLLMAAFAPAQADPNFSDNGDGTVTDRRTGFMWMRCHAAQVWDGNTCSGDGAWYGFNALKLTSNFANHSDWTVPTIHQLRSLLPYDDNVFPNQPYTVAYWSSTSGTPSTYLKVMQFSASSKEITLDMNDKSNALTVRFVRGSKQTTPTRNDDGTTTQHTTGLMWQTCLLGQTWNGATCTGNATKFVRYDTAQNMQAGAFKSNLAGYDSWRLPKLDELDTLEGELRSGGNLLDDYDAAGNPYTGYLLGGGGGATYLLNSVPVRLIRNLTAPAPSPAPQPTPAPTPQPTPVPTPAPAGFSITGNEYNSPRNNKRLRAEISGSTSTNAVYIWANVKGMGEFCYTPGTWTPFKDPSGWGATLSGGKNVRCPTPAGYLSSSNSGSSTNIDILGGNDLSSPLFDQSRVFVTLEPAGSTPTATIKNQKIMEFGGSAW